MLKDFINKIINSTDTNTDNLKIYLDNPSAYKDIINLLDKSDTPFKIKNLIKIFDKSEYIIKLMNQIYTKFKTSYIKYLKTSDITTEKLIQELNNFPSYNLKNNKSIHSQISKVNKKQEFKLFISNVNSQIISFNIFFYYIDGDNITQQIHRYCQLIHVFCNSLAKNIIAQHQLDNFNIRFLMIDFPRELKNEFNFNELSKHGIFNNSSGYTNKQTKEMVLSRKTGLTGLLIHELLHLLDLDFHYWEHEINSVDFNWKKDWIKNTNMLECTQSIKSNCGYYSFTEAICNTNSSYFLSIYSAIEYYNYKNITISDNMFTKVKDLSIIFFFIEYLHSFINTCKLLKFFGFTSYDSFFNNTSNRKYYQSAHVFEYIVLRTFLISDFYILLFKKINNHFKLQFSKKLFKRNAEENFKFQKIISDFIFKKMVSKDIKSLIDLTFNSLTDSITIEYFATNFLVQKY